jgi:hypothetical protein
LPPFYPGHLLRKPAGNLGLIAFLGGFFGFLAGEVQRLQQVPDVSGMIGNPGQFCDEGCDARKRPQGGLKAMGFGSFQESSHHLLELF